MSSEAQPRALVVDDSRVARAMIARALSGIYDITQAASAEEGFAILTSSEPFVLLVADWNMPGMSGVEFVRQLRSSGDFEDLKILMVTTEVEAAAMSAAMDAGVDEYLMKPFVRESVLEKLDILGLPCTGNETQIR